MPHSPTPGRDDPPDDALARLLTDSHARLLAYVQRRVSSRQDAEDILQDSLLRTLRANPGIREGERLAAWLHRVIGNAIIDHYRRRGTAGRAMERARRESEATVEPDDFASICACIETVLPTMNPAYAEIIRRMDLGEEAAAEVAHDQDVSRNNLKVRHHRARKQLRERLELTCRTCATHGCLDCSCGGRSPRL